MKLLFKQRFFSWFDSYDIFDEAGNPVYKVKGQLAWGHCLKIFNLRGEEVGMIKERVFSWLPRFDAYAYGQKVGSIRRKFTFFRPKFVVDYCGWEVDGNFWEWDYQIKNAAGQEVATVSKKVFSWTDTYSLDIVNPADALNALLLVLAIDAEKCSRKN